MVFQIELHRRAKDIKWSRKWAAIERYRSRKRGLPQPKEFILERTIPKEVLSEDVTEMFEQPEDIQPEQPTPEFPTEPTLEPSGSKEPAIKINTEPTIIELAGVISQDKEKALGPVAEFIFRMPTGEEAGRAKTLEEFAGLLRRIPLESVLHHANEQHFSPWLEFKGYHKLAKRIKNIRGDSKR